MGSRYLISGVELGMIYGFIETIENSGDSDVKHIAGYISEILRIIESNRFLYDSKYSIEADVTNMKNTIKAIQDKK